jgi:hypothetical protein
MLRDGMGEVYTSAGAEYSYIGLDKFKAAEAEAKRKKRGIWGLGKKMELPSDYKRRMKDSAPSPQQSKLESPKANGQGKPGFFGRLFGRQ